LSGDVQVQRYVALRFRRQVHQLEIAVQPGEPRFNELQATFHAEYERTFGPGTAYADAGIELVGLRVEATSALPVVMPTLVDATRTGPVGARPASFRGETRTCPVFDGERTAAGIVVEGPAFVEQSTTTLVVYPGQTATIDAIGNVVLELS
jgi:N-methylhydantoinase A